MTGQLVCSWKIVLWSCIVLLTKKKLEEDREDYTVNYQRKKKCSLDRKRSGKERRKGHL